MDDKPTGITFWVQGIVSARDGRPYVQIANGERMVAQLSIAEARNIAQDLIVCSSYAEADAMLHAFFKEEEFPDAVLAVLLTKFRDFRHALAMEKVETSTSDPDTGEAIE